MVQEKDNNMNKNSNHDDNEDEWVTAGSRGQHRKQKNFHKGGSSSSSKSGAAAAAAAAAAASSSSSSNKNNNNTNTQHSKTTTPRSHSFRQSSSNNNKGGRGGIISGRGHGHTTKNVQQRSQSFSAAVATSSSSSSLQPYQTRAAGGGGVGNKQHSGGGGGRGGVRRARSYAVVSSSSPSSSASAAAAAKDSSNRNTPNNKSNNNRSGGANKPQRTKSKRYSKDVVLLTSTTGSGGDDTENNHSKQQQVIRITADAFLSRRMDFLNIHDDYANKDKDDDVDDDDGANNVIQWKPHERCVWTDADRLEWIERDQKIYFNYKPLSVNEETRWKAKVMKSSTTMTASSSSSSNNSNDNKGDADAQWQKQQQQEEQIRKATAILNKLSWTTLDKLTVQFLETLGATSSTTTTTTSTVSSSASSASVSSPASSEQQQQQQQQQQSAAVLSKDVVQASMSLVVEKAMDEPHFAELYADFSSKLSSVHKVFRKALLALCQEQFENDETIQKDNTDGAAAAAAALTPEEKRELLLQKKRSIGLMKFIGELYKLQLIRAEIMVGCLQRLLQDPEDEEKVECYVKLMMTIGGRLHHPNETNHASIDSAELKNLWKDTYSMAGRKYPEGHDDDDNSEGPKAPSNRIKFLLQDLIELKEHDWISQRRQEEKAKTIAEIHKEVAKEEQDAARRSAKFSRSQSFGGRGTKSLLLSRTPPRLTRSSSTDDGVFKTPRPTKQGLSRTKSDTLSPSVSSLQRASMAGSSPASSSLQRKMGMPKMTASNRTPSESLVDSKIVEYLEPKECGKKMKSVLKEYFVEGGDMDYAATTVEELVGMGAEGDVARGAAVVEAGVLLVMEMKEAEVQKFQGLVTRCLDEEKLDPKSLPRGLKDPLEFLRDIELDAPHSSSYLADIVASWMKLSALDFDFLLKAPEYFLTDGKPALFAVQVLEKYCAGSGGDRESMISDALVDVVMKLMSEDEKKEASSPREWILLKMT